PWTQDTAMMHPYPYPPQYFPAVPGFFPATPTTSGIPNMMYPDTTVKSESEFGDTPPSSGSSNDTKKRKFKSPEEEKRFKTKRARNNVAAQKSRKTRKEREQKLMDENPKLKEEIRRLEQENAYLKQQLIIYQSGPAPFNNENVNPAYDPKAFQGVPFGANLMNTQ
ncbi:hypothetical protein PMAYCL1PPCAC_09203, partial [Pristionchus mayeri]